MPARDILHDIVKAALIKEGWLITHDPFTISFGIRTVYVTWVLSVYWVRNAATTNW